MPYSLEQIKTFEDMFGFVPDEAAVKTVKGLVQTIITDEAAADAAGIASKAEAPAAEDAATVEAETVEEVDPEASFLTEGEMNAIADRVVEKLTPLLGATATKSEIPTEQITTLQSELTAIKGEIGKPNAETDAKIADLEQRFKALLSEQPRQVAAAYDPTKDDSTIVQTAAKAAATDPAINDVVSWLIPSRAS